MDFSALSTLIAKVGKKGKYFLAKAHNAYQSAYREGQKNRLDEDVYFKLTPHSYLQHYVAYMNDWIPYIDFYPRNDIFLESSDHDCFAICEGKVRSTQHKSWVMTDMAESTQKTLTPNMELASASLVKVSETGKRSLIDVMEICQKLQRNTNPLLATMTLSDLMPYFNFILEDSMTLHVPLHVFVLSVEYFDEDDETQHLTFGQDDLIYHV